MRLLQNSMRSTGPMLLALLCVILSCVTACSRGVNDAAPPETTIRLSGDFCRLYKPVPARVTDPVVMGNEAVYCALCDTDNCPEEVVQSVKARLGEP